MEVNVKSSQRCRYQVSPPPTRDICECTSNLNKRTFYRVEAADLWLCINAEFSGGVFSSQLSVYVRVFVHVWGEEQEGGGVEGGRLSAASGGLFFANKCPSSRSKITKAAFFFFGVGGGWGGTNGFG